MEKNCSIKKVLHACFLFFILITTNMFAQVGIGTVNPDASSVLDVSSTTQGLLTPRMTTAQRTAIVSPANGLMVYDTDLHAFNYYDSSNSSWNKVVGNNEGRLNYKLIKSTDVLATVLATELAAGSGTKYVMNSTTLYEINGTVVFNLPIELNNAYLVGLDSSDDKIIKTSGDLFVGTTGGSIRVLTITVTGGGKVFDIIGTGSIVSGTQTQSLILRDCIVGGCSNVGKIENMAFMFLSIVQFIGNSAGIIYKDISKVLLSNAGWFGNNAGTYETLQGTFGLVEKVGGFTEVYGANVGLDVSSDPVITGDGVMESVVFTGTLSTGKYINGYTTGSYSGYNFDNKWAVRCAGVPNEGDSYATGNLYDSNNTAASRTTATVLNQGYKVNTNATATNNLYKSSSSVTGRLTYLGKKSRIFQVSASVSFVETSAGNNTNYVFYIAKIATNGTTVTAIPASETFIDTNGGYVQAFPITGTVQLNTNESVEIYLKRITSPGTPKLNIDVYSLNMTIK